MQGKVSKQVSRLLSMECPLANTAFDVKQCVGSSYIIRVTTRPDSCGTVPIIYLKSRVPKACLNVPHNPTLFEIYKFYKFVLHEKEILEGAK